jgi:DNA processing protein
VADYSAWVRLTHCPGIGPQAQRKLLKAFGTAEGIFAAPRTALAAAVGEDHAARLTAFDATEQIATTQAWVAEPGNQIVTLGDPEYPPALLDSADPPLLLYIKGHAELLSRPAIAIVGSRNATRQGMENAEAFAATLGEAGLTVVSGMALGIDAAAHRGALSKSASTLAVIGTGADRIYPARNAELARQIAERGALVSEFPLGTPPLQHNFPRRNRIIAGLVLGCLVVEAAERSGSLITARLAGDAGREVFAIPGSIHNPLARGCHALIRQGAKLVESARDILEELRWEIPVKTTENSSSDSNADALDAAASPRVASILQALGHDACTLDTLCARTALPAETLLAELLELELSGQIASLAGSAYQRVH